MPLADGLSLMEHIQIVTWDDVAGFAKAALTFVPGKVLGAIRRDVWVVSELPNKARDNGYWLFKHIRENHPARPVYYPIHRDAPDYKRVAGLGNVVEYGSLRHFVLYWAAKKYIGTTKQHGYPHQRVGLLLSLNRLIKQKYVFLNHGFARGHSGIVDAHNTNYTAVFAMSALEKQILVECNHQPPERVYDIGFCRHDNLNDSLLNKKLVLFMPTWRMWLDSRYLKDPKELEERRQEFLQSPYHERIQELLSSPRLASLLEQRDLHMIVFLHSYAQGYGSAFECPCNRITMAYESDHDVQELLKQAAYLITDYSSVVFDYAYMKKPCCYYQFDAEEFAEKQYPESEYYTYEKNGFGPVLNTLDEVLDDLEASHDDGFCMEPTYRQRVEDFFPSFGTTHCAQTFAIIDSL